MKTRIISLLVALVFSGQASAGLIFSDVTYDANSVSFRTTGDLSGYAIPNRPTFFSLGFEGDLFLSGVNPNISWSNAIFSGSTISNTGYSGDWTDWNSPGAWLQFSSPLSSSSIALGEITTLILGANVLNEFSTSGEIVFKWDVDASFTTHTELGRVSVSQVPVPGSLALFAFGLAGLGLSRKKKSSE